MTAMGSIGLVLGAGGVIGGAYHAGTLAALAEVADKARESARRRLEHPSAAELVALLR
ncbi:hypothetical protein BH18ACT4_BH18ACT4_06940 [soil metagenome]